MDERNRTSDAQVRDLYAAEDAATEAVPLRRFARFTQIESYVCRLTLSEWWSDRFPRAPVETVVVRRSHRATFSAAACTSSEVGVIALVDGRGWGLETVLHELAHLAAGPTADHGATFRAALGDLWRHEAGIEAWAVLRRELDRVGLRMPGGHPGDEQRAGSPRQWPRP